MKRHEVIQTMGLDPLDRMFKGCEELKEFNKIE